MRKFLLSIFLGVPATGDNIISRTPSVKTVNAENRPDINTWFRMIENSVRANAGFIV